jgi:hypothetical protein
MMTEMACPQHVKNQATVGGPERMGLAIDSHLPEY